MLWRTKDMVLIIVIIVRLPPVMAPDWDVSRLWPHLSVSRLARVFSLTWLWPALVNLNTLSGAASTLPWRNTRDTRTTFNLNLHSLLIRLKVNIWVKLLSVLHSFSRLWAQDWATLCEDIFRHPNLRQDHEGQQDEAERHGGHCGKPVKPNLQI